MSEELNELYSEIVMEHGSSPSNKRELKDRTHSARGNNPMCGDKVEVSIKLEGETIEDIAFTGEGCAFCMASTSLMTEQVKGQSVEMAEQLSEDFCNYMLKNSEDAGSRVKDNEDLAPVMVVKRLPMRIKCVTLSWRALQAALKHEVDEVKTESVEPAA